MGRWACASCARTSTWWRARVTSAREGAAQRLGIVGGTFNPPHIGHLLCAQEARYALGLDGVVFMPAGVPPHKDVAHDPGQEHRFEMCRLACEGEEWLSASRLELDRDGPSYTADTLREIHANTPAVELTFIVGADMAATLPAWREPEAILELASLAVADRDGIAHEALVDRLADVLGDRSVTFLDIPQVDVSSTKVRQRVGEGRPIRHIVPDAVARYIAEHGLYEGALG